MESLEHTDDFRRELRDEVMRCERRELNRTALVRMGNVVVAVGIDRQSHKATGCRASNVTQGKGPMAAIRPIDHSESHGMHKAPGIVVAGARKVAGVLMIEGCNGKVCDTGSRMAQQFNSIKTTEGCTPVTPFARIPIWRVSHIDSRVERRSEEGCKPKSSMCFEPCALAKRQRAARLADVGNLAAAALEQQASGWLAELLLVPAARSVLGPKSSRQR